MKINICAQRKETNAHQVSNKPPLHSSLLPFTFHTIRPTTTLRNVVMTTLNVIAVWIVHELVLFVEM